MTHLLQKHNFGCILQVTKIKIKNMYQESLAKISAYRSFIENEELTDLDIKDHTVVDLCEDYAGAVLTLMPQRLLKLYFKEYRQTFPEANKPILMSDLAFLGIISYPHTRYAEREKVYKDELGININLHKYIDVYLPFPRGNTSYHAVFKYILAT